MRVREMARNDLIRFLDSYASLLVLLLANFLLLEIVDDVRWGAVGSTLLAAVALVVAISDPATGHYVTRRHWVLIGACVALAPLVLLINSASLVGLTYLLPVGLLVTATLPITLQRILRQRRVTYETILGALCTYVLLGLLFAFAYLAVNDLSGPFFSQPGPHTQSEYLYFSFVTLTTLGFGDLSPDVGLPQGLTVLEALSGQIFLVTMVARLVTLWGRQSAPRPAAPGSAVRVAALERPAHEGRRGRHAREQLRERDRLEMAALERAQDRGQGAQRLAAIAAAVVHQHDRAGLHVARARAARSPSSRAAASRGCRPTTGRAPARGCGRGGSRPGRWRRRAAGRSAARTPVARSPAPSSSAADCVRPCACNASRLAWL